ncbi:MAG: tyrosine-protein phosphatase [Clostridia bacterium]|nr:tyrosine-protein phosphatase [Clostridia bacterium]
MKKSRWLFLLLGGVLAFSACEPTAPQTPQTPDGGYEEPTTPEEPNTPDGTPSGEETLDFSKNILQTDLCAPQIRAYLKAETEAEQFSALYNNKGYYDEQTATVSLGSGSAPYTVYLSNSESFSAYQVFSSAAVSFTFPALVPGEEYYWYAEDSNGKTTNCGKVIAEDQPVRYINVDGGRNVRDLGGWTAENGETVQYGLLYRGGITNYITEQGLSVMRETLGLKAEIDLRTAGHDDYGQTHCVWAEPTLLGYDREYIKATAGQYDNVFTNATSLASYKTVFEYLADEDNYPIYFHCNAGADRTGTLAFLINGLLGVSYEDLTRDFELTSFSEGGARWRSGANEDNTGFSDTGEMPVSGNYVAWGPLYNEVMKYGDEGDGLSAAIENFLMSIGVEQETLTKIKVILLGLDRDETHAENIAATCAKDGVAMYKSGENAHYRLTEKALGHDFQKVENGAACSRCSAAATVVSADADIKNGYDFSALSSGTLAAVTDENGDTVTLENGKLVLTATDVLTEKRTFTACFDQGGESEYAVVELTQWSLLIGNETDLRNAKDYELTIDGAVYGRFKLTDDIVCTQGWTAANAIASGASKGAEKGFMGLIEGNGKKISSLSVSGKDGALIYAMGYQGKVQNLSVEGVSNDNTNGSHFICAYTAGGAFLNVTVKASLGNFSAAGTANSALLGTIGFVNDLTHDISLENVTLIAADSLVSTISYNYSSALGRIVVEGARGNVGDHIKLKNVKFVGFKTFMVKGEEKLDKLDELSAAIGVGNMQEVTAYKSISEYEKQ